MRAKESFQANEGFQVSAQIIKNKKRLNLATLNAYKLYFPLWGIGGAVRRTPFFKTYGERKKRGTPPRASYGCCLYNHLSDRSAGRSPALPASLYEAHQIYCIFFWITNIFFP